ncbi:MAG: mandelate racemase/muconate lactonizing enzyme family protein [Chloroflexales bacterium]|nr:mandelate racemase/muconate lactonizing enzyme family protein [Chloroflexales bacterium]
MRIQDVEFIGLRSSLPQPANFSWGAATARNVGLVKVTTDDGLVGYGETSVTFPLWSLEERALTVREGLRPLVLGADTDDIAGLHAQLQRTFARLGPLWSPLAIHSSIGAFEMALWDLKGKAERKPLYQVLNPQATAEPIPLYAVGFTGDPDAMARQAAAALDDGFAAVKVRLGFGEERDLALLNVMRSTLGDSATLLADANMAWTRHVAAAMADRLTAFRLGWLEEPLDRGDIIGLAELRRASGIPIAAGENAYGVHEGLALIAADAVDIIMPDIARGGGIIAARGMIAAARAKGLPYSLHHYASDLGFAAALHLCTAEPGAMYLLRDTSPWPLRSDLLVDALRIAGGRAWPPDGAGLGITLDEGVIEQYRIV